MAANIYDLSVTAASNTTIDGIDVSGTTGKVKDGDNVIRSEAAFMAQKLQDDGGVKTTAGTANAQTVTLASGFAALAAGMSFRIKIGAALTNTSTTVTLNVNSIAATRVKVNYGGVLADPIPGDLQAGSYCRFVYDGTYHVLVDAQQQGRYPPGTLYGLTLSNNAGLADKLDVAVGSARDSTDVSNIDLLSALTAKDLAVAWAVGSSAGMLDTGAIGNNTYHIWLIKRADTGVVDLLGSLSATAPTMPTNYTLKRRIGSVVRTGGAIKAFKQDGDDFSWVSTPGDISATNPGTAAVTRTISVPTGIRVRARVKVGALNTGVAGEVYGNVSDLSINDEAPSRAFSDFGTSVAAAAGVIAAWAEKNVWTNTSAQVRSRVSYSDATVTQYVYALGWTDLRGRT